MQNILIVDDDESLCVLLKKRLEKEGFGVDWALNGKTALEKLATDTYCLAVLDVMMPEVDGFEVLRCLRAHSTIPVLMLTARDESSDKVLGLRLGADDYLTKPFDLDEFAARIHSLIRRYTIFGTETDAAPLTFGALTINRDMRTITVNGATVELPAKEFDILCCLAETPGRVFTKKQIYETVWQEPYCYDDSNIMAHISKIRRAIGADYIQTVKGVGYRFNREGGYGR